VFAAYKRNVAKRRAARAEATAQFRQRIAEINQKRDIELALIEIEKEANTKEFRESMARNNAILREVWSR
jgi:hypothetical protein